MFRPELMPDILASLSNREEVEREAGAKVHFEVVDTPAHTNALVEADNVAAVSRWMFSASIRQHADIRPVEHISEVAERALRNWARERGATVSRYQSSSGELKWITLENAIEYEALHEFLNDLGDGFATTLKIVMTDSASFNLRNEVAHGLFEGDEDEAKTLATLSHLIALRLAALGIGVRRIET